GISAPTIDKEITAQLKAAQLAKIAELSKDPAYLADRAAAARLFGTFPYGRPQIGTAESVQKIDFADLMGLRERFLTADNATITISGNFDANLVYRALRRYFGGWLKSDKTVPSTFRQPEPPKTGMPIFDSPVPDKSEFRIAIRGSARGDKDFYASSILASILDKRMKQSEGGKAFVRQEVNTLRGSYIFGVSDWNLGKIRREGNTIALPDTDGYQKRILDPAIKAEEFDAAKREYVAAVAQASPADLWLDIDTYKLGTAKAEADNLQATVIADVQRVLERLQKEPAAFVLVFGDAPHPTAAPATN
ncbi:MAG TPA: insulinase family protein, partial [Pyrinomonadaceae bacterium]|nr:insulinase family protein [Pyrinomonadaceae bacterium]